VKETDSSLAALEGWTRALRKDLRAGDFVLLTNNESVPADMVVLSSDMPDGSLFVSTRSLDGENNLKSKTAVSHVHEAISTTSCLEQPFELEFEPPNSNLYSFNGKFSFLSNTHEVRSELSLTTANLILSGSVVKNTKWLVGIVVGPGKDSKIMLNSKISGRKQSQAERTLNVLIVTNFIVLAVCCTLSVLPFTAKQRIQLWSRSFCPAESCAGTSIVVDFLYYLLT
jgi:phospholipid-translocating ATPase